MVPWSCAVSSASAICPAIARASFIGMAPWAMRSASVGPSTSSITSARRPSDSSRRDRDHGALNLPNRGSGLTGQRLPLHRVKARVLPKYVLCELEALDRQPRIPVNYNRVLTISIHGDSPRASRRSVDADNHSGRQVLNGHTRIARSDDGSIRTSNGHRDRGFRRYGEYDVPN